MEVDGEVGGRHEGVGVVVAKGAPPDREEGRVENVRGLRVATADEDPSGVEEQDPGVGVEVGGEVEGGGVEDVGVS